MTQDPQHLAVLFADITGSSKLYESLGDAEALATIDGCLDIVAKVCTGAGGRVVKTIGDEVMAVFPSADAAARAATDMQVRISTRRTSRGTPLAIHVGFHFGPIIEEGRRNGYWRVAPFFAGGLAGYYGAAILSVGLMAWGAGLHKKFKQRLFLLANLLLVMLGISYLVRAYFGK